MDGSTGVTVPVGDPSALSRGDFIRSKSLRAMCNQAHAGRMLVQTMFDVNRTLWEACRASLCGIPTIASRIGGLVEVVMDGSTGVTVPVGDPSALSEAILFVRNQYSTMCNQAHVGRMLVQTMFDVNRTALEVEKIYRYVMGQRASVPEEFNSEEFLKATSAFV